MILIKSIFSCNLSFTSPYSAHFGLKSLKKTLVISLYWFAAQQKDKRLDIRLYKKNSPEAFNKVL